MKSRHAVLGLLLASLSAASSCTSPNPEFPNPTSCSPGDRQCAAPTAGPPVAMVCGRDANDSPGFIEEPCPTSTLCDSGLCTPSQGTAPCQSQADCAAGLACVPLINSAAAPTLGMYCVPQAASAAIPGGSCAKDSDCQSYHCLQHATGRYCLEACTAQTSCGNNATCQTFNITVNGVQGSVLSCSPQ